MSGLDEKSLLGNWAWLLPLSYACHLLEEYFGGVGFPQWFSSLAGIHFSTSAFIILNAIALTLVTVATVIAINFLRFRFLTITLATIFLINASLHIITSVVTMTYSPGFFTGLLIWFPFGVFVLVRMRNQLLPRALWGGVMAGFGAHILLVLILFTTSR